MQHVVNKAHTRWMPANLISGHWFTLVTTGMGLQGTTWFGARLRKKRMCRRLENRSRLREA